MFRSAHSPLALPSPLEGKRMKVRGFLLLIGVSVLTIANLHAQSPSPAATPKPSATPTTKELIDSLSAADLQAAVQLLKNNFTNPEAINETQLSRATIEGLIERLEPGLMFLQEKTRGPPAISAPV